MSGIQWSSPGIFNVLDPWIFYGSAYVGMVANSTGSAAQNTYVLQKIIQLAQEYTALGKCPNGPPVGAIILFPGQSYRQSQGGGGGTELGSVYYLEAASGQPFAVEVNCNWPIRFLGTGSVVLSMAESDTTWGDMFYLHTNTGHDANIGGVTFEDLHFAYGNDPDNAAQGAAIHTVAAAATGDNNGAQNVRIIQCIFDDCPTAVWFEQGLQPSMTRCTVTFNKNVGTAVRLGAANNGFESPAPKEVHISNCIFRVGTNGAVGSTAMTITSVEHLRIDNIRMEAFSQGIVINPAASHNVTKCNFSNISCHVGVGEDGTIGSSLVIKTDYTAENPTFVSQLVFRGCFFEPGESNDSSTQSTGPGILIQQAHPSAQIENIRFVSCYSARWPGPGIQINGGSDIEILGGMYAGNNLGEDGTPASQPYGIGCAPHF